MSLHIFGNVLTAFGVAANNRGETEGVTTGHEWTHAPAVIGPT